MMGFLYDMCLAVNLPTTWDVWCIIHQTCVYIVIIIIDFYLTSVVICSNVE